MATSSVSVCTVKAGFHSGQDDFPQAGNGQESFLCLSVGTNGSNTKETFLSIPVLRKVFLSGNQPLVVMPVKCMPWICRVHNNNSNTNKLFNLPLYTVDIEIIPIGNTA